MKALNDRSLEEVVEELLKADDLVEVEDPKLKKRAQIQRLRAELRKYLNRTRMYAQQIAYLEQRIKEIEEQN